MDKNLLSELDKVLNEAHDDGTVPLTKDTPDLTRRAILEAHARLWLIRSTPFTYKLSSSGIKVLDSGSVKKFMADQEPKPILNTLSKIWWKLAVPIVVGAAIYYFTKSNAH